MLPHSHTPAAQTTPEPAAAQAAKTGWQVGFRAYPSTVS